MTPTQGANKLRKLLGRKGAWRINANAATVEQREEAVAAYPAAREAETAAKAARDARYRWVLQNDAEYQRVLAEWKAANSERERLGRVQRSYKITVGVDEGWCFSVKAEGDNWAHVIRNLEAQRKPVDRADTTQEQQS